MEKIECIYDIILKTKFEYYMRDVLKDINIIDFAITSLDIVYKTNVYNKMIDKYIFELDQIGYARAMSIIGQSSNIKLSDELVIRNSLSMLRKWIIRCSGCMCIRKIAEENVVDGIEMYMKNYTINEEVVDINTLNIRLEDIDENILSCLRAGI